MAGGYGYLHRGVVQERDATTGGYTVRIPALAPGRIMGPFPSMAPVELTGGQRVALASIGASRDDLVIIGLLPAAPLGLDDVTGLGAALAGKADDADVTALDTRVDVAETTLTALDGRLDTVEATLTTLDGRLDTVESESSSLNTRLYALELNAIREDQDLFGDIVSTFARDNATGSITLVNDTLHLVRVYARPALITTQIRLATTVAGVDGSCAIGFYVGDTLVRSGTINLATTGRTTHTLSSTYTNAAGSSFLIGILPTGYTTAPRLAGRTGVGHSSLLNPAPALYTSVTKAGQSALPATVDFADGTWDTAVTSKPWIALG